MTSEYNIPKHKVAVAESKTMWPGAGECVGRRGEYLIDTELPFGKARTFWSSLVMYILKNG